ncbi:MAG: MATE family efflux transporter [Defluviitaleaceae bacterium]|nr:MATE family efflux transporter [Defluviitaleaceae bacterium]
MKTKKYDLTEGSILPKLIKVAIPIMATSFIQMLHNLVDLFWLSRLSTEAVAAAGTGGTYIWLSMALLLIGRMGAEIGVSQNIGSGDKETAKKYAQNSYFLAVAFGVLYAMILIFFSDILVSFFDIADDYVVYLSTRYLIFIGISIPFTYMKAVITGFFSGFGNTKTPFYLNSFGLVLNIAISPIFIFTLDLGIVGAALSTSIAQIISFAVFLYILKRYKNHPFENFKLITLPSTKYIKDILKWGLPVAIESGLFTILTMIVMRFIANFGNEALAINRVGSQIEALSWLVGGGFATAVTAFVGQNYGAKKFTRIRKGFKLSIILMTSWGLLVSLVMFVFAIPIMGIFFSEPNELAISLSYMRILSFMQIPVCLEGVAAGCFRGSGNTKNPSIASITSNALRVVFCFFLSNTALGLDGIWIGLTLGAVIRGFWILIWYMVYMGKLTKVNKQVL